MVEINVVVPSRISAEPKPASATVGGNQDPVSEAFSIFFSATRIADPRAGGEKPATRASDKGLKFSGDVSDETPPIGAIATESILIPGRAPESAIKPAEITEGDAPATTISQAAAIASASRIAAPAVGDDINRRTAPELLVRVGASRAAGTPVEPTRPAVFASNADDPSAAALLRAAGEPVVADATTRLEPPAPAPAQQSAARTLDPLVLLSGSAAPVVAESAIDLLIAPTDRSVPALPSADAGLRLAPLPDALPLQGRAPAAFQIAAVAPRDGGGIEVRLDPPELGAVTIQFFEDDAGALRASVAADKSETLDLLRRNADALHRELARHGAGEFLLSFSQRRDDSGRNNATASAPAFQLAPSPSASGESRTPETRIQAGGGIDLIA